MKELQLLLLQVVSRSSHQSRGSQSKACHWPGHSFAPNLEAVVVVVVVVEGTLLLLLLGLLVGLRVQMR